MTGRESAAPLLAVMAMIQSYLEPDARPCARPIERLNERRQLGCSDGGGSASGEPAMVCQDGTVVWRLLYVAIWQC